MFLTSKTIIFTLVVCLVQGNSSKKSLSLKIKLSFVLEISTSGDGSVWDYHEPAQWSSIYPQCAGKQQSPIDIQVSTAQVNNLLKPIVFNNYNHAIKFNITNDGHSSKHFERKNCFEKTYV